MKFFTPFDIFWLYIIAVFWTCSTSGKCLFWFLIFDLKMHLMSRDLHSILERSPCHRFYQSATNIWSKIQYSPISRIPTNNPWFQQSIRSHDVLIRQVRNRSCVENACYPVFEQSCDGKILILVANPSGIWPFSQNNT